VRPRRAWFVFATTAVAGTLAAALIPSPWSIVCGVLAAVGATGAFVMFVVIVVLEDRDNLGPARGGQGPADDHGGADDAPGGAAPQARRQWPRGPLRPRGRGDH
jgi:hypothetical protein